MLNYPMPPQAAEWSAKVDWVNSWITDASLICIFLITGVMLYFALKYNRSRKPQPTKTASHSVVLETVWTAIPTVVVIYVFWIGLDVYREMRNPPPEAIEINVTGYQWGWNFEYENGKTSGKNLVVPLGRPVKLIMKSKDVLHSFFIPALRVKEDLAANRYSYIWFTPNKIGEYHIFCAEYCGLQHSGMTGLLKVVSPEDYQDYLTDRGKQDLSPAALGKNLFSEKGCTACHSVDGSKIVGPTIKGLVGRKRSFTDGSTVVADENYIRNSILAPKSQVVNGFQPLMPSFEGQMDDKQISALVAYIKTLK